MKRALILLPLALMALGCRGTESKKPPVHLIQDMDFQAKFEAQEANDHFADGRAMRPQVEGTVARGQARVDDHFYRGTIGDAHATELPVELTEALLDRGQERYNIFCAPCHDRAGTGRGIVVERGMVPPPTFELERLKTMPVGQIFQTISDGVRTMPSYAAQIPTEDRWAIVAYVRALQVSQDADLKHVPGDVKSQKGWSE